MLTVAAKVWAKYEKNDVNDDKLLNFKVKHKFHCTRKCIVILINSRCILNNNHYLILSYQEWITNFVKENILHSFFTRIFI